MSDSTKKPGPVMMDGNDAAAHVAHAINEVIAIYPITPSSGMGEISDAKSAKGETNIWGTVPIVVELQSEGGAAGAVHGSLTAGALTTTFTASQGLLLMIPNMYKVAGELTPAVIHVAARSLAAQGLSIFGDHSDVMAVRQTGWGMLAAGSVQETMDFALISQVTSLESRVPFIHFFDGFRTSHEVNKITALTKDEMRAMINEDAVIAHRQRGLNPDRPSMRGTAQNPDVYFQGRETVNPFIDAVPAKLQAAMDKFAKLTGRQYHLFDYVGAADAERIIIIMGSGAETVHDTVEYLNKKGEKVGVLKVRLYRPFNAEAFVKALPKTTKAIAVLDRTKEPGALGEPLYLDVRDAVGEMQEAKTAPFTHWPKIVGGRYGLGSKEFTPAMVKAVFDNLKEDKPRNHFTVGINDDVTHTSLTTGDPISVIDPSTYGARFYGLGSDGTVGANKATIKIIGDYTEKFAQGYFVYDSKKSGTITTSHLRFGDKTLRCPYLVLAPRFVACHNPAFLEQIDMLVGIEEGGVFLINHPQPADKVWDTLPIEVQKTILDKKLKVYCMDAIGLAEKIGLGERVNIFLQAAFFEISKILPHDVFVGAMKDSIKKTYGRKGDKVVEMNYQAIDSALANINEVKIGKADSKLTRRSAVPAHATEHVKKLVAKIVEQKGDQLPVSAMPVDGTFPTATSQYEKRNIAVNIPVWDPNTCVQCGLCSLVCPHAAIRTKVYDPKFVEKAPKSFKSCKAKGYKTELSFTVQVAPEDCTGCATCVYTCPAFQKDASGKKLETKAINMQRQAPLRVEEAENFKYFLEIPDPDLKAHGIDPTTLKGSQMVKPMFEFSGACAGCGETNYVKLLTQLFGDRLMVANATGCSSIYGGNLPTTPYCTRADGRGPAWANSLFEDNAEFGYGMRLAVDSMKAQALQLADQIIADGCKNNPNGPAVVETLKAIKAQDQSKQEGIEQQRANVAKLNELMKACNGPMASRLKKLTDYLVDRSVWVLGGDGWAYDIGYGGLDHVIASGKKIKLLVLDTEVYSNTGGQASKSTPLGAVARFAEAGKRTYKKDLGMIAMTYGTVYVAKISLGANPAQVVKALVEADSYDGPALVIAYSHCINHGINMSTAMGQQKRAVECGHWPLFRFDPRLIKQGKNPLQLDCKAPTIKFEEYAGVENRYRQLKTQHPDVYERLMHEADQEVKARFKMYQAMAGLPIDQLKP